MDCKITLVIEYHPSTTKIENPSLKPRDYSRTWLKDWVKKTIIRRGVEEIRIRGIRSLWKGREYKTIKTHKLYWKIITAIKAKRVGDLVITTRWTIIYWRRKKETYRYIGFNN